ncbi:MAG: amidohydrolase/deacetylase family metallohydrolase [Chloroflexi bacterium]|nr:amidohydrolase/deacetylase family metallohydrolase [Chloroflexota bacterium]
MAYDLLIKGGTLIDPAQGINGPMDVAISGDKVAAVADSISDFAAAEVVDASGLIVTPGLIDLHVHVFWGASHYGIEPDGSNVAKGVTTALDAGSAGARTFPAFRRYVLERADTRLYALLNISAMGMISPSIGELEDIRWANIQEAIRTGREHREYILGIKARLGRQQSAGNDLEALKRALQAANVLDGFVMIHVGGTETPLLQMVDMLRPGDVVTHAFHGNSHGILDDSGKVIDGFVEARDRGVIFDIGHGRGSFSFDVAEKALSQGFYPGNISSDLHVYNIEGPVHDQLTTLSKFLHLGLSLEEVIRLSTETTAKAMGLGDRLGTLRAGAEADVTLMRLEEGHFPFEDSLGVKAEGTQRLTHALTIRGGKVYRPWLQ